MKERFIDFIEKFYKFMETKEFNHENEDDRKIVQKRINMMMDSSLMQEWIKQNIQFGKHEQFTDEVFMYLIDCATDYHDEKEFLRKIKPNSYAWILKLDIRVSKWIKKN